MRKPFLKTWREVVQLKSVASEMVLFSPQFQSWISLPNWLHLTIRQVYHINRLVPSSFDTYSFNSSVIENSALDLIETLLRPTCFVELHLASAIFRSIHHFDIPKVLDPHLTQNDVMNGSAWPLTVVQFLLARIMT